jgi:hypothetical protein
VRSCHANYTILLFACVLKLTSEAAVTSLCSSNPTTLFSPKHKSEEGTLNPGVLLKLALVSTLSIDQAFVLIKHQQASKTIAMQCMIDISNDRTDNRN